MSHPYLRPKPGYKRKPKPQAEEYDELEETEGAEEPAISDAPAFLGPLKISDTLHIPLSVVTQKLAFLGISGSGKTYGSSKLVETMLNAGAQVVIVDTVGNWAGLRLKADGKTPAFPIPIAGGDYSDFDLKVSDGKNAARAVVETRSPLILDVSDFVEEELMEFTLHFATELLRLKKKSKWPVMVVWEECQEIVPQVRKGGKEGGATLNAVVRLIKKGRNYGVGTILISQRTAAVSKEVLNQAETLFAFRQNAKLDRKAIQDWVVDKSIDVLDLVEQMPTLETGECFCWSPQWLGVLKRIKFRKKLTYDGSSTPEFGKDPISMQVEPIEPPELRKYFNENKD